MGMVDDLSIVAMDLADNCAHPPLRTILKAALMISSREILAFAGKATSVFYNTSY